MQNLKHQVQKNKTYFSAPGVSTRGFTLVEIIVVIAVILILVAIVVQGFSNYANRQVYVGYVSEVKDNLVETRQRTIASYADTVYGVYVGTSTIEFFEGSSPVVGLAANTIMEIPGYMTATSSLSDANWYVTFKRITGEASATGTILFTDTRTNASTTFTIHASGLVE
jgi:prepilin-type N-terminal cleavage/methylation domain-containing protein